LHSAVAYACTWLLQPAVQPSSSQSSLAVHGEGLMHLDLGLWQFEVHCTLLLPVPIPCFCSLQHSKAAVNQVLLSVVKGCCT